MSSPVYMYCATGSGVVVAMVASVRSAWMSPEDVSSSGG